MRADYRCSGCGAVAEFWVGSPIPPQADCPLCGSSARRLFGTFAITGRAARSTESIGSGHRDRPGHGHAHDVPGGCVLTPVAARMLDARMRGDNRAIEREIAFQESAIAAGTLDPAAPVVTPYAGAPTRLGEAVKGSPACG